jgi:hypothetical protein
VVSTLTCKQATRDKSLDSFCAYSCVNSLVVVQALSSPRAVTGRSQWQLEAAKTRRTSLLMTQQQATLNYQLPSGVTFLSIY